MTEAVLKIKNLVLARERRSFTIAAFKSMKMETLNTAMILSIIALIVFYLFMANNVAMANYGKTVLQKDIEGLRMEIRNLNLELTNKRSVGFLMKAAQDLGLVINEGIQYIKIIGPVAKNP
ncbi:MAG: hypothetical protein HYW79_00140 [Parcubacteria group bacterium]|nr:hypothetical protein [Parcubacteria group bacterium]